MEKYLERKQDLLAEGLLDNDHEALQKTMIEFNFFTNEEIDEIKDFFRDLSKKSVEEKRLFTKNFIVPLEKILSDVYDLVKEHAEQEKLKSNNKTSQ